jgi:hypothetical protein
MSIGQVDRPAGADRTGKVEHVLGDVLMPRPIAKI